MQGNKNWYRDPTNDSFIWWCNSIYTTDNIGGKYGIEIKIKIDPSDEQSRGDVDECKEAPDRRGNYAYNSGLSNSNHWDKSQTLYAQQCAHSFSLLQTNSLQFHHDYWQGVLVCLLFS